jgi:predicted small secreted protein
MKTAVSLMLVLALSACSTVAGVGKDIQSSAEWTKEKMGGSK